MLRRSILELSSHRSGRRILTQITTQTPSYLSSRRAFSSQQNEPPRRGSTREPSESGNYLPKVVIGGIALAAGAAFLAAYQTGYLDELLIKEQHRIPEAPMADTANRDPEDMVKSVKDSENSIHLVEQTDDSTFQESDVSTANLFEEKNPDSQSDHSNMEDVSGSEAESQFQTKDAPYSTPQEDITPIQEKEFPSFVQSSIASENVNTDSGRPAEESLGMESPEVESIKDQHEALETAPLLTKAEAISKENETDFMPSEENLVMKDMDTHGNESNDTKPSSLIDEYYLRGQADESVGASSNEDKLKNFVEAAKDSNDAYISKDGKLILDFLQAIHAAEKRQAELDARVFSEEKRTMKEKYEKELKDAKARELMYAEREALLDKELNKEKIKAAAALKSLQKKLEDKLDMELELKETETEMKLKKMEELAKAELAAAIASEKASQIEKMAEANLNINALCMAFYARSEEARQSHSVHKLALGALALEDALSKGLPIQKEIDALRVYLEGIEKDSLLDLVLTSLPEETRNCGTDTLLQLNNKFDALKGTLRHFSLIPPGGGGIMTHSLAHVATWLKVKEADQSGDGIESLINRVESFLSQGKLCEAADTLENGVKGSQAAEVVHDWVKRARDRAITEQALSLLQSYASSISIT